MIAAARETMVQSGDIRAAASQFLPVTSIDYSYSCRFQVEVAVTVLAYRVTRSLLLLPTVTSESSCFAEVVLLNPASSLDPVLLRKVSSD